MSTALHMTPTPVALGGGSITFRYTRGKIAIDDRVTFQAEWSDTLQSGSWSTAGVTQIADLENPGDSDIENWVVTAPRGGTGRRFIRLNVTQP